MAKGSGSTRASASSSPRGLSTTERLNALDNDTIISQRNALQREIRQNWNREGDIEAFVKIPGVPLVGSYNLFYNTIEEAWKERVQVRSTIDSSEDIWLTKTETSRNRPNIFEALGSGDVLKDLLREYNKNRK